MAVVTENIVIRTAEINEQGKLVLDFTTTKTDSSSITEDDYKPILIAIDNQCSFICKNEESQVAYKVNNPTYTSSQPEPSSGTYTRTYVVNTFFSLDDSALNPKGDLLFVYIYSKNATAENYLEAVVPVYYNRDIYDKVLNVIKSDYEGCDKRCATPINSTSAVNMLNGLVYSIELGEYRTAATFWNMLNNLTTSTTTGGCNCN